MKSLTLKSRNYTVAFERKTVGFYRKDSLRVTQRLAKLFLNLRQNNHIVCHSEERGISISNSTK
jgi:hypothetical protein